MPYAPTPVTPEALLDMMKPGAIYPVHNLARKIRVPSAQVKVVLLEMVRLGMLVTIKPRKNTCFMLAGTKHLRREPPPKPQIDPSTVALPRTYAVLTGEIRGYDAEIARRKQLCMMVRG